MKKLLFASVLILLSFQVSEVQAESVVEDYFEVSPAVIFYSGDAMRANSLGGLSATHHFNRMIWLGADFFGGKTKVDSDSGLQVRSGQKFFGTNATVYFNLPAFLGKKTLGEEGGLRADLYTSIGGGSLWLDKETEPFGFIGGGMIIHFPIPWLTLRFDLKNLFFVLQNSKGSDFNSEMALGLGPSFKIAF